MKKIILRFAIVALLLGLGYGVYYAWVSFPIITGYNAKILASSVFVAQRSPDQIQAEELNDALLSLATNTVDYTDSSVTSSIWGMAKQKAIYRKGLGVCLVNELSEGDIRSQRFNLPEPIADTATAAWPHGYGSINNDSLTANANALKQALNFIFNEPDTAHPKRTRALLIVHNGKLVAERYAAGFSAHTKLLGWSMTKSVTSALIGRLVQQGKLGVQAPAPVPEWRLPIDNRNRIQLQHLLQQTSGLDFEENYGSNSSATRMLFRKADMGAYTASLPLRSKPGSEWYYSSGNSNILARVVRHTIGDANYHRFVYDSLLYAIGMYSAVIEPDASGTFVGSSYMYATARDWAKFGWLYCNDGIWNGQRLLPEGWVKATATPASASKGQYGYQFWLNAGTDATGSNRKYPSAPTDMFWADGYEGQFVAIIPSKQLVIVRLGLSKHPWDEDAMFKAILKAF